MAPETIQQPTEEKEPETLAEGPEQEPEEAEGAETGNAGNLFSPEAVIILPLAVFLDLIGVFLLCFGLDDFGVTDIFGIVLIGGWMLSRSHAVTVPEKAKQKAEKGLKKLFRGKGRFLTPIFGELIPYVGALPCWTLAAYYELTS